MKEKLLSEPQKQVDEERVKVQRQGTWPFSKKQKRPQLEEVIEHFGNLFEDKMHKTF